MDMTSPASKRTFNVSKDSAEAMQCLCSYLTRTTPERRDVLLLTLNTFITKFTSMETQNQSADPTGIYLFKENTGNTRSMFEGICSMLTKTPDIVLLSLLLTLDRFYTWVRCFHCWL